MKPLGVGIDLVEVRRVRRLLERHPGRAVARLLTEAEREYCFSQANPELHVAARLAAKEAAYKALACNASVGYIGWQEFEVAREITGRPTLQFHARAGETAERLKVKSSLLSLTHTGTCAAAVVVLFS